MAVSEREARAHEMMNALSIIGSTASLVMPRLSEQDRTRMERLDRAVSRLVELVRDDMDDAHASSSTSRAGLLDVEVLVRSVCDSLRERAERAGIRVIVDCEGGCLRGDAAALEDTLFKLLSRAIEATPKGRDVRLETRVTGVGDQLWTIEDWGAGMPPEVMLSASVATSHGGSLVFESHAGEGTKVRVWLPRDGKQRRVLTVPPTTRRSDNVVDLPVRVV
jgi:signal transduction histidine kinase